jgi:hypothetical protein
MQQEAAEQQREFREELQQIQETRHPAAHSTDGTTQQVNYPEDVNRTQYATQSLSSSTSTVLVTSGQQNGQTSSGRLDEVSLVSSESGNSLHKPGNEWQSFLQQLSPIKSDEWKEANVFGKVGQSLKAPIFFLLSATVPVVDAESPLDNWCRMLNCLHLITGPFATLLLTGNFVSLVTQFPLISVAVGLLLVLSAFFVFLFTSPVQQPRFHFLFAYLGFVVSVVWIYSLANEVVSASFYEL